MGPTFRFSIAAIMCAAPSSRLCLVLVIALRSRWFDSIQRCRERRNIASLRIIVGICTVRIIQPPALWLSLCPWTS
ncbi:hypothetical protein BCR34DRAFT_555552 [Clohesyomyces aquaticus]|uniref:Uncharacterized protein n=1 Tax=Clohesyomyces aquaticus TaxID=1231657 RepID=A0A1Y2A4Q3_9PLEO|nr:hypothetical protein BCR34DRAFT_555552 [Clohesyomyces aquaticus]